MTDHDHADTDLTDPHGEAEALRRENERLRAALHELTQPTAFRALPTFTSANATDKAPFDASRAPDPVVNAGSCRPGDLISQAAAICDKAAIERRQQAANGGDASQKERWLAGAIQAEILAKAIRALPAAPVAEAQPTIGGAELDALVARLRGFSSSKPSDAFNLVDEAADAITALRAQPDWKAMAERLVEAADRIANWTIGGMLADDPKVREEYPHLSEAILNLRAALSDMAKMKGE